MSTELITFSLTDYTSLRTLELEYSKARDENAAIRSKLAALEELYRKEINAYQQTREEWAKKEKKTVVSRLETEKELSQLIESICVIESELIKIDKMGIDLGLEEMNTTTERMGLTQSQKAHQKLGFIKKCLIELLAQNNHQAVHYQKEITMLKQDVRTCRQSEKQLKEQLICLEEQLSKMQRTATHLQNQLSQTKREYVDYKLKFYEEASIVEQKQDKHEQMLEDNNFALDLLNFQKELLEKIFNKLLSSLQNDSLTETLSDIYNGYESICELFRQKLQIEYDLEDLQREYKKEKNSKISENLLIELRKQIQEFRNELSKQKQSLAKQEETLQQTFLELKIVQKDHKRMKTYSLEIENKIKDIQHHNHTKNGQQRQEQENASIKFKPTQTTQQLMKEVVRKDKQNLQKIFRETRMGYLKQTSDA